MLDFQFYQQGNYMMKPFVLDYFLSMGIMTLIVLGGLGHNIVFNFLPIH